MFRRSICVMDVDEAVYMIDIYDLDYFSTEIHLGYEDVYPMLETYDKYVMVLWL